MSSTLTLRDYQQAASDHATEWASTASTGDTQLYAAPTGVGKSVIELDIQHRTGYHILTPRLEIARGFLEKQGMYPQNLTELVSMSQAVNIYTPIRFRNLLFRGQISEVKGLIVDEGHHQLASSYRDDWVACGMPPLLLFTATPYRGTSRATAKFRQDFGEPTWIITLTQAAQRNDIAIPVPEILPLVDDDVVELSSTGEFVVTALESAIIDRLSDIARVALERWIRPDGWDRTTIFCLPTVSLAKRLATLLPNVVPIHAATPDVVRRATYAAFKERKVAICQVSVLGEGVDLPVRRLIDLSPIMSPVKWMQMYGRATRPLAPGEPSAEYIVTNRNLLRHAYLLEGLVPAAKLVEADIAFGPSERSAMRAFGLELLGRFKAVNLKLVNGSQAQMYMLVDTSGGRLTEYACLYHATFPELIWATRRHSDTDGTRQWGRWQRVEAPLELRGFASQSPRAPSPKQISWWESSAKFHGLDPDVSLTRKNFAALPLLKDLGLRLA